MKAAVLFSGQLRHLFNPKIKDNIFSFLKKNTTSFDFYCSFWDFDEIDKIHSNYSPIKIESEEWGSWEQNNQNLVDTFINNNNIPHRYAIGGILGQWYQINKCFSLIENPQEYDIIIRTRTDITFPIFDITHLDLSYLYVEGPYIGDYGYKDYFFFSNPKNMKHVTNLFPNINSLTFSLNHPHPSALYKHILAEHVFKSHVDEKCDVKYFAYDGNPKHTEYFKKIR